MQLIAGNSDNSVKRKFLQINSLHIAD